MACFCWNCKYFLCVKLMTFYLQVILNETERECIKCCHAQKRQCTIKFVATNLRTSRACAYSNCCKTVLKIYDFCQECIYVCYVTAAFVWFMANIFVDKVCKMLTYPVETLHYLNFCKNILRYKLIYKLL